MTVALPGGIVSAPLSPRRVLLHGFLIAMCGLWLFPLAWYVGEVMKGKLRVSSLEQARFVLPPDMQCC